MSPATRGSIPLKNKRKTAIVAGDTNKKYKFKRRSYNEKNSEY